MLRVVGVVESLGPAGRAHAVDLDDDEPELGQGLGVAAGREEAPAADAPACGPG